MSRDKHLEARYPFAAHHADSWELEHIHAQKAPILTQQSSGEHWVEAHKQAVLSLPDDAKRSALLHSIEQWRKASQSGDVASGDAFRNSPHEIAPFMAGDDSVRSEDEVHGLGISPCCQKRSIVASAIALSRPRGKRSSRRIAKESSSLRAPVTSFSNTIPQPILCSRISGAKGTALPI